MLLSLSSFANTFHNLGIQYAVCMQALPKPKRKKTYICRYENISHHSIIVSQAGK